MDLDFLTKISPLISTALGGLLLYLKSELNNRLSEQKEAHTATFNQLDKEITILRINDKAMTQRLDKIEETQEKISSKIDTVLDLIRKT